MNLILFGPPGAGKGTQAKILSEKLNVIHLSTGEILRTEIRKDSTVGKIAKSYIDYGNLVPDDLSLRLFQKKFLLIFQIKDIFSMDFLEQFLKLLVLIHY